MNRDTRGRELQRWEVGADSGMLDTEIVEGLWVLVVMRVME